MHILYLSHKYSIYDIVLSVNIIYIQFVSEQ